MESAVALPFELLWELDWEKHCAEFRYDFPEVKHNNSDHHLEVNKVFEEKGLLITASYLEHDCYSGTVILKN